ncbi:phage regulatory protein/antirepressor Ant [Glaesserella parasuis]|uniref:phage regulatory protein/antirepressor Ant n=1 Tax=Glaesserella parasuis TaxID=738 RepID=UPI00243697A8|nr:phage regulatory protein/antirepressor Ant [Glaesserella parasuis]MDG6310692.1 phage regulatory protein/antirepressor Ant [Glaesserella parasuis]
MKTDLLSTNQRENATLTMSSREIARITESRHRDVCLSIRNLMNKGVIGGYAESPYTHEQNGQVYYEYHINKRDTYVIVAQFSPEFTARLVDRWQELENQQKLPSNYLQALKALVESEEEKQTLLLENQTMKPKADFVDHYVEVGTSKSLRETAKILNFPEKRMIECLERDRVLYRQSGNLLPYSDKQSKQLFTVKTGTAEHGHNFTQTRVTGKGIEWIAQRYASELGL